MPPSSITVTGADGVRLVVHHLGGVGPPVMLAHATGFHGRCWIPLASVLASDFTVWALDQRGHGASGKSPDGRYDDWDLFAADLLAAVEAIGGSDWRAGGHSLGGGVSLLAEARRPGTFKAICIYEPVVVPPGGFRAEAGSPPSNPLATLARKRRPSFPSRQAAIDNYRSKPPMSRFDPEALWAYVEYGVVDQPDGTVALACRPEDEASVFDGAITNPVWDLLPAIRPPVAILAGGDDSDGGDVVGRIAPDVARHLPRGGLLRFEALDHFGPMTAPREVGAVMARALAPERRDSESTTAVTSPG